MSNTALDGSTGSSVSAASQSDVETYSGSDCITSSNIQYAIGAVTSWVHLSYVYDASGPSSFDCRIDAITGLNTSDWDIHDPTTDTAAWLANSGTQVYIGDLSKNFLVMFTDMATTNSAGSLNPRLEHFFADTVWRLKDPQFNLVSNPTVATAEVYLIAIRKAI